MKQKKNKNKNKNYINKNKERSQQAYKSNIIKINSNKWKRNE